MSRTMPVTMAAQVRQTSNNFTALFFIALFTAKVRLNGAAKQ
ncbi:MAG TPA: hypothetical protein PKB07_18745 [Flavilitoribacter sp.]|nr:hypothetical protein [Flavilitoribacter sp.]